MDESDRPPLIPYVWEEIEESLHKIDTSFWAELSELRVKHPLTASASAAPSPMPPKKPEHLRITLQMYATRLFRSESDQYPVDPQIELWLSKLADRVLARVINAVNTIDRPPIFTALLGEKQRYGLTWHGLSPDEMQQAIRTSLEEIKDQTLTTYRSAENPQAATNTQPRQAKEPVHKPVNTAPRRRARGSVASRIAARKMEQYIEDRGMGYTEFATLVGTTDRTLRSFRVTGKVRRDIFERIANAMGTTKEALLKN